MPKINMEEYKKWKRANYFAWLILLVTFALATNSALFSSFIFKGILIVVILSFLYIQLKVSFCKCGQCDKYIINPSHFWFGTAIFTNKKQCNNCEEQHEKDI